jgi:hypothetical protein
MSQYVFLYKRFRSTSRGDLSISAYAALLQTITNDLANIGYPVADSDLTLTMLAGLRKKFWFHSAII